MMTFIKRRKLLFRIFLLFVLAAVYITGTLMLNSLEKRWNKTASLYFELPFPADMEEKYDLVGDSGELVVIDVVVAGFFSNWDPFNDAFAMKKTGVNKWQLHMNFPEGDNQYKFAVYAKKTDSDSEEPAVYWIYDKNSKSRIDDGFNGYNSSYNIYDAGKLKLYLKIIIGGFALFIILFTVLEPFFHYILNLNITFRYKIIFSALTFGLLTNLFFIAMSVGQQRELARDMVVDFSNMIHVMLKSEKIDFNNLNNEKEHIGNVFDMVLKEAQSRISSDSISNDQIVLNSIALFDPDFDLIEYSARGEITDLAVKHMEKYKYEDYNSYCREFIFADAISSMEDGRVFKKITYGRSRDREGVSGYSLHQRALGFSNFIKPVYVNNMLVGFYGAEINVHFFGEKIMNNVILLLLMLPLLLIFYFILFSITGRWITGHLNTLLVYTNKLIEGDFSAQKLIKSGDEIEMLASNFDVMRSSLRNNIEEIESKNKDLTRMKDNLEIMVDDRTRELTGTMTKLEKTNGDLRQMNHSLVEARRTMDLDMEMAINVQSAFLMQNPPKSKEWDIAFTFLPMAGVSGDMYDFYTDSSGALSGVTLMDVSGHGVASGLITMIAKSVIYRNFKQHVDKKFSDVIELINEDLISELGDVDNYLTGIMLRFDGSTVEYVNAGHTELLWKKTSARETVMVLPADESRFKGFFLGIEAMKTPFKQIQFTMEKDDILLLYSDCLNESTDENGSEFGVARIMQHMNEAPRGSAKDILKFIMDKFHMHTGKNKLPDDLTVIALKRLV